MGKALRVLRLLFATLGNQMREQVWHPAQQQEPKQKSGLQLAEKTTMRKKKNEKRDNRLKKQRMTALS